MHLLFFMTAVRCANVVLLPCRFRLVLLPCRFRLVLLPFRFCSLLLPFRLQLLPSP
ncbi:hypothetical protein LJX78_05370 [Methanimicrococcus blatticola]|uniref:hypothetical protein n=1 Tax=Methanimicrococcus blatticola TaxID=91560 RepID=UPI001E35E3D3|nr:hypothetical protein [Methanimicrococcus blatticola]MCC2509036.1 hypothetical protein [Methanimicrococcus blatticola]